jgi:hypothetical protein
MMQVPFEWMTPARSGEPPPYWVTYYGEIYSGTHINCHKADDRFFILSYNQFRDYQNLKDHSLENYQKLAWEIRDTRIISAHIPGMRDIGDNSIPEPYRRDSNRRLRRIFVFGAGASAHCSFNESEDSLDKFPLRPPIGYEIFDSRFDNTLSGYEGALASVSDFEANGRDIEGSLESDWGRIRNAYSPYITARHTNIQFYLQDVFSQISEQVVKKYFRYNLYAVLCNRVLNALSNRNERASFVSFNYDTILDTLLERAMQVKFTGLKDYIGGKNNTIVLLKPHGSSNWGWPFMMDRIGNTGGKSLAQYIYDNRFVPSYIYYYLLGDYRKMVLERSWGLEMEMTANNLGRFTINKNAIELMDKTKHYLPALQLPYSEKDDFIMPTDHFYELTNGASEVEELYLIGWKGNEEGFNRLLKNHSSGNLKRIVIVNPNAEDVIKNLAPYFDLSENQTRYTVEIVRSFREFVLDKLDGYLAVQ